MNLVLIRDEKNFIKDALRIRLLGYSIVFSIFKDTKREDIRDDEKV